MGSHVWEMWAHSTQLTCQKFMGFFLSFFIGVHLVQTRSVSTRSIFLVFFLFGINTKNKKYLIRSHSICVESFLVHSSDFSWSCSDLIWKDKRPNTYFIVSLAHPLFGGVSFIVQTIPFLFTRISNYPKSSTRVTILFIIRIKSDWGRYTPTCWKHGTYSITHPAK